MFKDCSNVIYEIFNESDQKVEWATYKPTMQDWVDVIRGFAKKNLIFAGSPEWDQMMGATGLNPLKGENIVYVAHMYQDHWTHPEWGIRKQVEDCAKYHPVVMTEWGFSDQPTEPRTFGNDLISVYGKPILEWLEGMGGSWTAWCASSSWLPEMFTGGNPSNWVLRIGPTNMGGFVKVWMYTHKDDRAPF